MVAPSGVCGREVLADTPANVQARGGFRQAVAGWRREAGEAARDVLLNGGNAIDAAAAALLVLCVVDPTKVGIGGYGGSLALIMRSPVASRAIDSDSRAPRKFDPSTFKEFSANYGYLAVGVPGVVAGIDLALREYGTLSFKTAAKYALALAENGIPVTPSLSSAFQGLLKQIDPVSRRAYFPNGVPDDGSYVGTGRLGPAHSPARRRRTGQLLYGRDRSQDCPPGAGQWRRA